MSARETSSSILRQRQLMRFKKKKRFVVRIVQFYPLIRTRIRTYHKSVESRDARRTIFFLNSPNFVTVQRVWWAAVDSPLAFPDDFGGSAIFYTRIRPTKYPIKTIKFIRNLFSLFFSNKIRNAAKRLFREKKKTIPWSNT